MQTEIRVLNPAEIAEIHVRSLRILGRTGVRVESARARKILGEAGASIDDGTHIVCLPASLIEEALRRAPRQFNLGGRRPGWSLALNSGDCTLLADGEGRWVVDAFTGERRAGTRADWLQATQLLDALQEIGVYWRMIGAEELSETPEMKVAYWASVFRHFSKHVQDQAEDPFQSRWLLEVLGTIFGGRQVVREVKPFSFLLCPVSPLVIEENYTDAYLETIGWDIPAAIMPMPLMGMTSPGRLISTILLGNCEVLAMLCLIQAAAPGTPVLYAPVLAAIDPRTGKYTGGGIENALLSVAAVQMGRFYSLPVEASTGGTDAVRPGIRAGYERALNWSLPTLAWPDILVGPGLFEGSTVLSFEQLLLDVEVFRQCRRLHFGIGTDRDFWLDEVIERIGPGGHFLAHPSTRQAVRGGEWYLSEPGGIKLPRQRFPSGERSLLEEVRASMDQILAERIPLPLDEAVEKELSRIQERARLASVTTIS